MSTGQQIAQAAESQVGTTNGFKYLGGNGSQAWCDDFASWCLKQAGVQGYGQQASVPQSVQWAKNNNMWHGQGSGYSPKVGDLVTFDWNGDGTADHVGVVTGVNSNGTLQVTSGNSNGYGKTGGESANAGAVTNMTIGAGSNQILGYIATSGGQSSPNVGTNGNAGTTQLGGNSGMMGSSGLQPVESFSGNANAQLLQNNVIKLLASALGMSGSQLTALESSLGNGAFGGTSYTVQPGDTLSGIAAKYGVPLSTLEAANPQITNPNLIYPGQTVNIPSGVPGQDYPGGNSQGGNQSAGSGVSSPVNGGGTGQPVANPTGGSTGNLNLPSNLQQYKGIIESAAQKNGISPALLAADIEAESSGNPNAVSSTGAEGLGQLEPSTARSLGVTNPFDPEQNVNGQAKFLGQLLHQFGGNQSLALAAYNAGPGAVQAAGNTIPQNGQTPAYVQKVLSYEKQYSG